MYTFAGSSERMLKEAHKDLKFIAYGVKEISEIDFDISCVKRSDKEQIEAYKNGKTNLDGVKNKSNHQKTPPEALDLYCYTDKGGKASYTAHQMAYIAGLFRAVSMQLYREGKIKHLIRWGGNWDQDGILITDQDFDDLPHFELCKPVGG